MGQNQGNLTGEECCGTCRYHKPIQTIRQGEEPTWDDFGKCHRYPPHNKNNSIAARAYFPTVSTEDWCGEYVRGDA